MPEKGLTEIHRELRALFTKGRDALQRENFEYAIALFNQVLEKEPTFYEGRESLRKAQQGKAGAGGTGFFKKMFNTAGSSPMVAKAQLALRNNPLEAIHVAEQVLNGDPTNSQAHRIVAEAAVATEMPRTAVLSLEVLHRHSPRDKHIGIQLGHALANAGNPTRAERVLAELYRELPNDADVAQALKDLSARKTMGESGYEKIAGGTGSYRDILRNKEEATSLEQEKRAQKTEDVAERLIGEYESRLKTEPDNLKLLRQLAELCTQKKQFDRALGYYAKIKASPDSGSDPTLDRAIAETAVRKLDHAMENLDATAHDYVERNAQLAAEKESFQLDECRRRVEKFPTDLGFRFELGQLYFQAGRISEAIPELQKAQANPHKRSAAMNLLAQCYAKRKMNDLAAKTLHTAIKEKVVFDDDKKELLYNLAGVLENMGQKTEAFEQLKLIYEVDSSYKDVGPRVDKYYEGQ